MCRMQVEQLLTCYALSAMGFCFLQALESQAGFPPNSPLNYTISKGQWEEFMTQLKALLLMLRQIATVSWLCLLVMTPCPGCE